MLFKATYTVHVQSLYDKWAVCHVLVSKTLLIVEPRYLELGYFEHPSYLELKPLFFSHLLSGNSNFPLSQTVFCFP